MAIGSFNKTNIAIERVNASLFAFVDDSQRVNNEYRGLISELQQTFTDSQKHWVKWASDEKQKITSETGQVLSQIDEIVTGMDSIEKQLCAVDKSYEKRRNNEYSIRLTNSRPALDNNSNFLSLIQGLFGDAKKIADECSLTSHSEIIQEIGMIFSGKRKEMYEQLYKLLTDARHIRQEAFATMQSQITVKQEHVEKKKEDEIAKAADETASLIQQTEEQLTDKNAALYEAYLEKLNSAISATDIQGLNEIKGFLEAEGILPNVCREHLYVGEIRLDLSPFLHSVDAINLINEKFAGYIQGHELSVPSIYDLSDKTNFCFMSSDADKQESKDAIHSLMFSQLQNQPASRQEFILFDPEGRSKGFDLFLDFFKNHNDVMGGRIITNQNQMRQQLESLSNFVDDIGQTKFVGYNNIFEYNNAVSDKQESLKCLCIMDFPKYFDENMLDTLYSIAKNGSSYGVSVILQYCVNETDNRLSQNARSLADKVCSEMTCFSYEDTHWKYLNGVIATFKGLPTKNQLVDFDALFEERYNEIKKAFLPVSKILSENQWYTGDSTELISVPIGKNEDGGIQSLEFGDAVGNGTSHYALIIGSTGSGKSTLLHTLIMNAITKYSPDEVNLYLMDFKSGTEFKIYAESNIPHIKLLALDAMQEFGQSILDELWEVLHERSRLFKELLAENINVKDITQYRKMTGKKMPRILVIADEFQMLFSEDNNRKIAYACGARMADFISLARVYGIHFILATQTMSRLASGFSIRKATLNEMHVRIGLQCTEPEAGLLFGDSNGKIAFNKMGTEKGSAVYTENDVRGVPVGFKVAFCDQETQESILKSVSHRYSVLEPKDKTLVFMGDSTPSILSCPGFNNPDKNECLEAVPIYLGEPIRIAPPVTLNIGRMKRNNLLIVGSEHSMLERLVALYVVNAVKTHPYVNPASIKKSVYLIDGLTVLGEGLSSTLKSAVEFSSPDINIAKTNYEAISFVDEIYDIFETRRKKKLDLGARKSEFNTIHLVIHDFQWVDSISLLLANKSISDYAAKPVSSSEADDLFDFVPPQKHKNDMTGLLDSLISQTKASVPSSSLSTYKKFISLIESGYTYGINIVLSCPDYQSIKELMYEIIPKFSNRVVFAMSNSEADRFIQEVKTESLRSNIVIFSDGVNPPYQFKPYGDVDRVNTLSQF